MLGHVYPQRPVIRCPDGDLRWRDLNGGQVDDLAIVEDPVCDLQPVKLGPAGTTIRAAPDAGVPISCQDSGTNLGPDPRPGALAAA